MKTQIQPVFTALFLFSTLGFQSSTAFAQGTAFTYQGRLNSASSATSGNYDLTFSLFTVSSGGSVVAGPLTNSATGVSNGLFLVTLDFGNAFAGTNYWLEVGVRTNGSGAFITLSPRQAVTPAPYAIFAEGANAAGISGTIPAANVGGTYNNPVTFNNGADSFDGSFYGQFFGSTFTGGIFTGAFVGTGSGLGDVWHTGGNSGTTAGPNFVGTTDNQPLELHVNGQRVLRLTPDVTTNLAPNIIGGSPVNWVAPGLLGVTISGGGAGIYAGQPGTNQVLGDFNTIGGGWGNTTGSTNFNVAQATIGGGAQNTASGISSTIGGGADNVAWNNDATVAGGFQNRAGFRSDVAGGNQNTVDGDYDGIGGGLFNNIQTNTTVSAIGGGYFNRIQGNNFEAGATIGGGGVNLIQPSSVVDGHNPFSGFPSSYSTIGGGYLNQIQGNSVYSTIGGGQANIVQANASDSTIAGGMDNTIQNNAVVVVIAGGSNNIIQSGSVFSTIGGGYNNTNNNYASVIGGGYNNFNGGFASVIGGGEQNNTGGGDGSVIGGGYVNANGGSAATIGGGQNNLIQPGADHAVIGGGGGNLIIGSAALPVYGTIAGGGGNIIQTNVSYATIGGGNQNTNSGNDATIGGGFANTVSNLAATIPGGYKDIASGNVSFAAGEFAQATNAGAFVWSDASGQVTTSTNDNSVTMRASGGFRFLTSSANPSPGAYLAPFATSWTALSDRNAKKDFAPVDAAVVLDKLARVPVEQWHYKWESSGDTPNLGPMAQDFKAAFYPGRDDKGITTLEFDGVELAAIQGLNQKLNEKDAEIQKLKEKADKVDSLEKRLNALEQMLQSLAANK